MASSSGGGTQQNNDSSEQKIAINFQHELNLLTEHQPPISKERINQIVRVALKEIRNYKHVVYYVENFIKNCSYEYKIPGLYVIDAIIRNCKSQQTMTKHQKEIYTTRFSKNICKTFTHLYIKSSEANREKITRVLQLWQKYSIFDVELIDRLNRIASAASIDAVVNGSTATTPTTKSSTKLTKEAHNLKKFKRLQYLQEKLQKIQSKKLDPSEAKKVTEEIEKLRTQLLASSSTPNRAEHHKESGNTTTSEINKLLNFENDDDSYSDSELLPTSPNKRSKKSHKQNTSLNGSGGDTSGLNLTGSERLNTSITNCTVWLQQEELNNSLKSDASKSFNSPSRKTINLPDMTQPPPPLLMSNYTKGHGQPPLPPLPPLPVDGTKVDSSDKNGHNEVSSTSDNVIKTPKERERDRVRRGLPNIREQHICICSKTLWLGHLAKCTTEDYVVDELTELLSPSSSDSDSRRNRNNAANRAKNTEKIIVDCQLIPPRGCAYVEFIDRRTASKCLERMKDGYRLEGNSIKVAWATNKGISKDRQIKVFWNVEVGCTFVPWTELTQIGNSIDFIKWAEGGLVDEESIPPSHIALFKKQMLQLANADDSKHKKSSNTDNKEHDMEIDTEPSQIPTPASSASTASTTLHDQQQNMMKTVLTHTSLPPPPPPPPNAPPMPIALSDMQKQILNHLRTNQPGMQGNAAPQFLPGHLPPNIHPDSLSHFQQINQANPPPNGTAQHGHQQPQIPQGQFPPTIDHHLMNNQLISNQQHHQRPQVLPQGLSQQYVMHLPNPSHPHIPQHYQLVQRPVIIPNQQHLGPKPGGVNNEILANIFNGTNSNGQIQPGQVGHEQIQLMQQLAQQQQSQNQQQQQRINIQMQRNMMGMAGQPLAGQHMIQNPAMIQFIQQQHRQKAQQQAQMMAGGFQIQSNQEVKVNSPPVSSTTTDEPPVQTNSAQPKSLMEMSLPPPIGLNNTDQIKENEMIDHEKLEEKDERNRHGMYDNRNNNYERRNNDYYDRRSNEYDRRSNEYDRRSNEYDRNNRRSRERFEPRYDSRFSRDEHKRHSDDYQRPQRHEPAEKTQNGQSEHTNFKPEDNHKIQTTNPLETSLNKNVDAHVSIQINPIETPVELIKQPIDNSEVLAEPESEVTNGQNLLDPASTTEIAPKDSE